MKSITLTITIMLIMGVFLSGCVSIDMNQKIYRDGSIDFSITFSSEVPYVLNMMKDEIANTDDLDSEWIYTEDTNSFTLSAEHMYTKDIDRDSDNAKAGAFISQPEITKEFKFPYYYYTYSFVEKAILPEDEMSTSEFEDPSEFGNINELISISYNVETFGEVVDTSGLKTSENSARFRLSPEPEQEKRHYITFKDLFFRSWLKM